MGGGDLNMKKHFHPLTQENLERVWKAEEKKRKEEERITQLQQEIQRERQKEAFEKQAVESGLKKKKKEKLDWMYAGQQSVDTEAYLLGKKIDKNVEAGKEEALGLSSGVASGSSVTSSTSDFKASDILAKIKEDPLFLIKKKEEENKSYLMANTIKMKKMRELIEGKTSERLQPKQKKNKKKKRRHSSSSSSSYSGDERYSKHKKVKKKDLCVNKTREEQLKKDERRDSGKEKKSYASYERSYQPRFRNDRTVCRSDSSCSDDDEMEAQRNAMMSNAKWRQSQREKETKKYHTEKAEEERDVERMLKKSSKSDEKADFVQKMQRDSFHAKSSSVEDRIHRNIHSKQRTVAALDKKFTRK